MIKQINMKGIEKSTIEIIRPCAFTYGKQKQLANQERVFESCDHHNAKWTFTSQDHQLTKISPILQALFLYSVNIYKYDI